MGLSHPLAAAVASTGLSHGLEALVAVGLVAALAPLVVALLPGPRMPQVVIFLLGGILIGPHVLGLSDTYSIELLANIGLGFLFLLAGFELDTRLLRQRPGRLAVVGWLISAAIAVGVVAGLGAAGYIRDYVPVGLALTTTALGDLLPILRDNEMSSSPSSSSPRGWHSTSSPSSRIRSGC
jgi:Kef-type K+ transport system membrane component KefB